MTRIAAFLGLGAMGGPMAAHVVRQMQRQGGRALVWNRTREKAERHAAEFGGEVVDLPGLAEADVIFTCLPTSAEVDEVLDGVADGLKEGATWVDCTSGHPEAARRQAARLVERGVAFLDAPVSGGTSGAQAGTLTVMVGGDAAALGRVRDSFAFAGKVVHVGDVGSGFAVKAVNNALLAVTLWATGEGLAALARSGVNLGAALEVINASSGRSNASQNLIPARVLTREFPATFGLGLLAKDAGIAADVVREARASAPVLMQVEALMRAAATVIGADEDHTAALRLIERMNATEIK
ncbi:3-hydroxyisobutyrate dehydrogenase [Deinococcus aetherius]|uniref:3-hydroxyisobutyrate dehydrogenase n=1 Tax=Deinococcus aetherius TaxID=200252 RepID=A0ABN6RIF5_9DEIO|nr:NAD(P)-dependent oxidoreductase [Deinococcus aetherius]BDP41654.1 3-hydroxyisobutyrate dehydrogenase [Deinococcus aetherius]